MPAFINPLYDPPAPWQCPAAPPIDHDLPLDPDPLSSLILIAHLPVPDRLPMLQRALDSVQAAAQFTADTLSRPFALDVVVVSALDPFTNTLTNAATTRNRGIRDYLDSPSTPDTHPHGLPSHLFILDDDDELKPDHFYRLLAQHTATQITEKAPTPVPTLLYPYFEISSPFQGVQDPLSIFPITPAHPNFTPPLNPDCPFPHTTPVSPFAHPFDVTAAHHLQWHGNFIPVTSLIPFPLFLSLGGFPTPHSPQWPYQDCEDWGLYLRMLPHAYFAHVPFRTWRWHMHGNNTSGRYVPATPAPEDAL